MTTDDSTWVRALSASSIEVVPMLETFLEGLGPRAKDVDPELETAEMDDGRVWITSCAQPVPELVEPERVAALAREMETPLTAYQLRIDGADLSELSIRQIAPDGTTTPQPQLEQQTKAAWGDAEPDAGPESRAELVLDVWLGLHDA